MVAVVTSGPRHQEETSDEVFHSRSSDHQKNQQHLVQEHHAGAMLRILPHSADYSRQETNALGKRRQKSLSKARKSLSRLLSIRSQKRESFQPHEASSQKPARRQLEAHNWKNNDIFGQQNIKPGTSALTDAAENAEERRALEVEGETDEEAASALARAPSPIELARDFPMTETIFSFNSDISRDDEDDLSDWGDPEKLAGIFEERECNEDPRATSNAELQEGHISARKLDRSEEQGASSVERSMPTAGHSEMQQKLTRRFSEVEMFLKPVHVPRKDGEQVRSKKSKRVLSMLSKLLSSKSRDSSCKKSAEDLDSVLSKKTAATLGKQKAKLPNQGVFGEKQQSSSESCNQSSMVAGEGKDPDEVRGDCSETGGPLNSETFSNRDAVEDAPPNWEQFLQASDEGGDVSAEKPDLQVDVLDSDDSDIEDNIETNASRESPRQVSSGVSLGVTPSFIGPSAVLEKLRGRSYRKKAELEEEDVTVSEDTLSSDSKGMDSTGIQPARLASFRKRVEFLVSCSAQAGANEINALIPDEEERLDGIAFVSAQGANATDWNASSTPLAYCGSDERGQMIQTVDSDQFTPGLDEKKSASINNRALAVHVTTEDDLEETSQQAKNSTATTHMNMLVMALSAIDSDDYDDLSVKTGEPSVTTEKRHRKGGVLDYVAEGAMQSMDPFLDRILCGSLDLRKSPSDLAGRRVDSLLSDASSFDVMVAEANYAPLNHPTGCVT